MLMTVETGEKKSSLLCSQYAKSSLNQRQIKHLWEPTMFIYLVFFLSKQEEEEAREQRGFWHFLKPSKCNTGIQVIKFSLKQREK